MWQYVNHFVFIHAWIFHWYTNDSVYVATLKTYWVGCHFICLYLFSVFQELCYDLKESITDAVKRSYPSFSKDRRMSLQWIAFIF